MDRVDTGIVGLDAALSGGIPKSNLVLLSGGAGTGKSTMCMHFLIAGAKKGEKSIYVSTEQTEKELVKQAEKYSLPLAELVSSGLIKVVFIDILNDESVLEKIRAELKTFVPDRVVIDSLSTFSEFSSAGDFAREILLRRGGVANRAVDTVVPQKISERTMVKRMLGMLISSLRSLGATIVMTSELPERGDHMSSDGVSEYLVDGVVVLHHLGVGLTQFRSLQVRKMRYTKHSNEIFGYDFAANGISFVDNAV